MTRKSFTRDWGVVLLLTVVWTAIIWPYTAMSSGPPRKDIPSSTAW
jgi:hypothetical protein